MHHSGPEGAEVEVLPAWLRPRPVALALGALLVLYAAVDGTLLGDLAQLTLDTTIAALMVFVVARRRPLPVGPWWLMTAGTVCLVAADDVYTLVVRVTGGIPDVSPLDLVYLVGALLIVVGAVRFVGVRTGSRDVDGFVDAATVLAAVTVLAWEPMLRPALVESGLSLAARLVSIAYPVLDVLMIGVFVRVVTDPRFRSPASVMLGAGAVVFFTADLIYGLELQAGVYGFGGTDGLLNASWSAAYLLFLLAAMCARTASVASDGQSDSLGRGRIVLSALALIAPAVAASVGAATGEPPDLWVLVLMQTCLVGLVLFRLLRLSSAERRAREVLTQRERYYEALTQSSSDAVVVLDDQGSVLDASAAVSLLLGYEPIELLGRNGLEYAFGEDLPLAVELLEAAVADPGSTRVAELRVRKRDGAPLWLGVRVTSLLEDPAVGGIVVNLHDVTARKAAEDELTHQAFYDGLTGLANRALFGDRLHHALAARGEPRVAVLYCDLDRFKYVNDSLGHAAGDRLLQEIATRLAGVVRPEDTVARLGGDEFAFLLEGVVPDVAATGPETVRGQGVAVRAERVAERILAAIAEPVDLDGSQVVVTASIGIAVAGGRDDTADDLLRDADMALYAAKSIGRNRFAFFAADMRDAAVERLHLEADLRRSLDNGELRVLYQPIVDLAAVKLIGFEALLRWEHPSQGLLAPDRFLPIAEDTGLIVPIGAWVLKEACRTAQAWNRARDEPLTIWVNMSGRQVESSSLVHHVTEALASSGLDAHNLVLELTETVLVSHLDGVVDRLAPLKDLGVRIAVDDFGTGYSSLAYLENLPVDIVKIDRSFVEPIDSAGHLPVIVQGILDLGSSMGLQVLGEGIETKRQAQVLRAKGCELGQGFVFARPVDGRAAARIAEHDGDVLAALDALQPIAGG